MVFYGIFMLFRPFHIIIIEVFLRPNFYLMCIHKYDVHVFCELVCL